MFEGSHLPLRKLFIATYIFASHKKGISSLQLGRDLGITQKTAWFVLGRFRNSFKVKTPVNLKVVQAKHWQTKDILVARIKTDMLTKK